MPEITADLLDRFSLKKYADPETISRGELYYKEGRVVSTELDGEVYSFKVIGSDQSYLVHIRRPTEDQLSFTCTCPHARRVAICKHIVASVLTLKDKLNKKHVSPWQDRLNNVLEYPLHQTTSTTNRAKNYVAFFVLDLLDYFYGPEFYLKPYVLRTSQWPLLNDLRQLPASQVNDWLVQHREWESQITTPYQALNPNGCINLSPEAVSFFNFMIDQDRYDTRFEKYIKYLPLMRSLGFLIFFEGDSDKLEQRLFIQSEPAEIRGVLSRTDQELQIHSGLKIDDQTLLSTDENFYLLSKDPTYALCGNFILPIANPDGFNISQFFPLSIPLEEEETFLNEYFPGLVEKLPLEGDKIEYQKLEIPPTPRLYLRETKKELLAELRFGYGDYEIPAENSPEPFQTVTTPQSWTITYVKRDLEIENKFYDLLKKATYRLKRSSSQYAYNTFQLRARAHPFDFLMYSVPALTQAGFEIYGEENIKSIKINRNKPKVRLNISSGIDWFDLNVMVEYGDQEIALKEIRKALKKGTKYIKLADDSIGEIPEEWLNKYKHLWGLAEEKQDGYRLSELHLPVLESLLEEPGDIAIPPDLAERQQRLRNFEKIKSQPLPLAFTGELRPYQKAGFDWLHFLREYKFGGILADDMGLGKTIQVLAYLQALKEDTDHKTCTLLVVPKSLLANWQKEGARFTPNLNFLEYMGNTRQKDITIFNDYDIILTTYGTMLRDAALLRSFHFTYIILDESQAIKNPLSQSAKAARLLQADYRLCMTGTPVENNSFELWSQFAFLNPGLLGNLDFFKNEFASPIEGQQDEKAAQLLRSLVYPFILRRTKQQVAPELPPRSERVLYTEMTPRQHKLYNKTREKYRSELLNLIDSSGVNNNRMKILEGLLRLRQIAIHPALVEPDYKGEAPKFELLLETLETLMAENHKALIFSQFIQTLKFLREELDQRKIPYNYLDGKTKNRQEQVDSFQNNPDIPFFLISLKAGGVGLNLTAADYVIHLDPWWNPAVEMQASDRAHRIGQDKPVFIYKLIARDTVEEKILKLQEHKKALVESLITTESSFFKSLSADDVSVLFGD
ncbi:MAG: serine/threonine protein kinase [Anaerolineaceae bacterium]|nr:serine/threonine protein kinase [Anaerolineaceae bacterium]